KISIHSEVPAKLWPSVIGAWAPRLRQLLHPGIGGHTILIEYVQVIPGHSHIRRCGPLEMGFAVLIAHLQISWRCYHPHPQGRITQHAHVDVRRIPNDPAILWRVPGIGVVHGLQNAPAYRLAHAHVWSALSAQADAGTSKPVQIYPYPVVAAVRT